MAFSLINNSYLIIRFTAVAPKTNFYSKEKLWNEYILYAITYYKYKLYLQDCANLFNKFLSSICAAATHLIRSLSVNWPRRPNGLALFPLFRTFHMWVARLAHKSQKLPATTTTATGVGVKSFIFSLPTWRMRNLCRTTRVAGEEGAGLRDRCLARVWVCSRCVRDT